MTDGRVLDAFDRYAEKMQLKQRPRERKKELEKSLEKLAKTPAQMYWRIPVDGTRNSNVSAATYRASWKRCSPRIQPSTPTLCTYREGYRRRQRRPTTVLWMPGHIPGEPSQVITNQKVNNILKMNIR